MKPSDRRLTPAYLAFAVEYFARLVGSRGLFDPCTERDNPVGAVEFCWVGGLQARWPRHLTPYVNPPWSDRGPWDERAIREAKRRPVVVLGEVSASAGNLALNRACVLRCDLRKRLRCRTPDRVRKDVCRQAALWVLGDRPDVRTAAIMAFFELGTLWAPIKGPTE